MAPRAGQAAAPLRLLPLPLMLLLLLAPQHSSAQDIKLVSGPGCADLPPSPPTELRAVGGDGNTTLSWSKPANGACVTEYQITVIEVDAATGRSSPRPAQATPDFTVTISGLQNGLTYRFFVRAFAARYRGGGEAQVAATPLAACDTRIVPTAPTGLSASPAVGNVSLCWGPPKAAVPGCVDEYRVAVVAVQQTGQRSAPSYRRYNKGGCVTIEGLTPGQLYNFSVQAWSASMRAGSFATVQATPLKPPRQWRCVPVPTFYPLCSSAAAGLCTPLNCQQQFAKGQCSAPFMRIVDPASLTVIQHCSDVCGCSPDPNLGAPTPASAGATATASRAAPGVSAGTTASPADPAAQPADSPITVTVRGLRAAATAAPAAAVSGGWASPSGCCVAPPRTRAAWDDEVVGYGDL